MNVKQYIEKIVPGILAEITMEELLQIQEAYNVYESWSKTEKMSLEKGMDLNRGIDYANDFEKASTQRMRAQQNLNNLIKGVEMRLGSPEMTSSIHR